MSFSAILEIISGVLKFPDAVLALIRVLKSTPEEDRQKIIQAVQAEADAMAKDGRPRWD